MNSGEQQTQAAEARRSFQKAVLLSRSCVLISSDFLKGNEARHITSESKVVSHVLYVCTFEEGSLETPSVFPISVYNPHSKFTVWERGVPLKEGSGHRMTFIFKQEVRNTANSL